MSVSAEAEYISDLIDRADHLTVEQAVGNREQAIEENISLFESEGTDAELEDPDKNLRILHTDVTL